MTRAARRPSPAQQVAWHLSLLGHRALDLARFATRGVPAWRLAIIACLLALLVAPAQHLTVSAFAPAVGTRDASVAQAGLSVGSLAPSGGDASARAINDAAALAAIGRLGPLAQGEAESTGVDAGVLLVIAIASGSTQGSNRAGVSVGRVFGSALDNVYATPTQSWRAMSLTLLAEAGPERDRESLLDAAARLYPASEVSRPQLAYLLERYAL